MTAVEYLSEAEDAYRQAVELWDGLFVGGLSDEAVREQAPEMVRGMMLLFARTQAAAAVAGALGSLVAAEMTTKPVRERRRGAFSL